MPDLFSTSYQEQLRQKHAESEWGSAGYNWAPQISAFAKGIGAHSILDYGCGKGTLSYGLRKIAAFDVREYDPGIPEKSLQPVPADIVVSTDVLEHVEPENLDSVIRHLNLLSLKGLFLVISCRRARETLPDGRNAHLSVHPPAYWIDRVPPLGTNIRVKTLPRNKVLMEIVK